MVFGQFKFSWRNRNAVVGADSLQGFITNFFYEEHFVYIQTNNNIDTLALLWQDTRPLIVQYHAVP